MGAVTCHGGWSPGSFGHYEQDAHTFAAWRVDYVKMDWCGGDERSVDGHTNFSRALNVRPPAQRVGKKSASEGKNTCFGGRAEVFPL